MPVIFRFYVRTIIWIGVIAVQLEMFKKYSLEILCCWSTFTLNYLDALTIK